MSNNGLNKSDRKWADFGKSIWDRAIKAHINGAAHVVVPFVISDGGTCSVVVTPPRYTESRLGSKNGQPYTQWRHGVKLSDGSIKWDDWS